MVNVDSDLSLYIQPRKADLHDILEVYVDDLCAAGNSSFDKTIKRTEDRFDSRKRQVGEFYFAGIHVKQDGDTISVDQLPHASRFDTLPSYASFEDFRSKHHTLVWLIRTDAAVTANLLRQIMSQTFKRSQVVALNKIIGT